MKTFKSDPQKVNSEVVKEEKEYENHEIEFKDLDQANDIFLKPNSEQVNDIDHSKDKNKMLEIFAVDRPHSDLGYLDLLVFGY
mgnify:CR=1 FL=1